jgi:uncharacterized protein
MTMRSAYEAYNRGDIPAALSTLDRQIEWHEPGGGRAPRGTFHGPESVQNDVFATVRAHFDEFRADPEHFIDAGDQVVVVGHFRGRAKNGQELEAPFAHVWAMRHGKAVRLYNYVQADAWTHAWGGSVPHRAADASSL